MAESACLESTCAGNGTVGSNPTLSATTSRAIKLSMERELPSKTLAEGGIRTGVLKGVFPLHGVTGAKRRREGAWPPSGSGAAAAPRLRIPSASTGRGRGYGSNGGSEGVCPLHGVTGAKRRREGAWPPSGSGAGRAPRRRIPTLAHEPQQRIRFEREKICRISCWPITEETSRVRRKKEWLKWKSGRLGLKGLAIRS